MSPQSSQNIINIISFELSSFKSSFQNSFFKAEERLLAEHKSGSNQFLHAFFHWQYIESSSVDITPEKEEISGLKA